VGGPRFAIGADNPRLLDRAPPGSVDLDGAWRVVGWRSATGPLAKVVRGEGAVVDDVTPWLRLDALVVVDGASRVPPVAAVLASAGHRVRVIRNDVHAVAALGDDLPDLAVVDHPPVDGPATALAEWGIPVLTAERVLAALAAGNEEVLLAPFGPLRFA
jgi:hypothetical protein